MTRAFAKRATAPSKTALKMAAKTAAYAATPKVGGVAASKVLIAIEN